MLREKCRAFAEALQTVNILKDVAHDAEKENSIYVPEELLREHGSSHATILAPERAARRLARRSRRLVQLAWHDLEGARSYLLLIPRRAVSIRLFCVLPLLFAYATLRDLTRTPQALVRREVVKISRREVKSLTLFGFLVILSNRGLAWLADRAMRGRSWCGSAVSRVGLQRELRAERSPAGSSELEPARAASHVRLQPLSNSAISPLATPPPAC